MLLPAYADATLPLYLPCCCRYISCFDTPFDADTPLLSHARAFVTLRRHYALIIFIDAAADAAFFHCHVCLPFCLILLPLAAADAASDAIRHYADAAAP